MPWRSRRGGVAVRRGPSRSVMVRHGPSWFGVVPVNRSGGVPVLWTCAGGGE
jgi:hypothetical protein